VKIAAISDDGETISRHFGRASLYVVAEVKDGQLATMETRPKSGHHSFAGHGHSPHTHTPGERRGYGRGAQARHTAMMETISDCQVLLVGGMGWGAYEAVHSAGIEPILTDVSDIQEAVRLYAMGELPSLVDRLH
jgi:predicted Fe-Mo cluster-binding NifX family protein